MYQEIAEITATWHDYPDAESLAVEVFLQGCLFDCKFCQNKSLQIIKEGKTSYENMVTPILTSCKRNRTDKIVFVGGEPLLEDNGNLEFIKRFLNDYKDAFNIMIYTGNNIDYVRSKNIKGFTFIKTGLYKHKLKQEPNKTDDYMIFASTNQELYDSNLNLLSINGIYKFKREEQ